MKNIRIPKLLQYALGIIAIALLIIPAKVAAGVGLAAMFNFSTVDFNGEEVRDLKKVIMDETYNSPKIEEFHNVIVGTVAKMQVVYMGQLSKLTKADAGCGTGATSKEIALRPKTVDPVPLKVWLQMCASELDSTLMVYAKKKGKDVDDLEGTEIASIVTDKVSQAMSKDLLRIAWFNDTTNTNVGDGSGTEEIKAGVSLTDYTMLDGFWSQIKAIVAADATRKVAAVAGNSQATYALQDSVLATATTEARDVYRNLLTKADPRLQAASDKIILSTRSLANNYADYLETQGVDASFVRLESGFDSLSRRGTKIIVCDFWDEMIRADIQNGTKYFSPHRALLTTPGNLGIYIDDTGSITIPEMWYSKDTELNNWRDKYKADVKIALDYMIQVAY